MYGARATVRNLLGDGAGALADSDRTLALMPESVDAYRSRGDALRLLENFDRAIADYTYVLQQPKRSEVEMAVLYVNRGRAYHGLGRYGEAIADYTQAIELHDMPEAFTYRGISHLYGNDAEKGLRDFLHVTQLQPAWSSYYNQAIAQYLLGRLDQAMASLNECLRLDDNRFEVYYFRGNLYYDADDKTQASRDFQQAQALESVEDARKIDPADQHGFYQRGVAQCRMGQQAQALADLHQAAQIAQRHQD